VIVPDARALYKQIAAFRRPDDVRGAVELAITLVPFVALWVLSLAAMERHYGLSLFLAVPAAGLLVRLFLIQHDCGHGSMFRRRGANDWVGRGLSVLTLTPYDFWRRTHAMHHAAAGNLDRRGFGDVDTLTVAEFAALSPWARARYRFYRHPLVLFGLAPAYLFLLQHRVPIGLMREGWGPWISTVATSAATLAVSAALVWWVGLIPFLAIQLPITIGAASIGVWLFYVQHQFERTSWDRDCAWGFHEAALHGSSHYVLPPVLQWFTANVGIHHVHHLCSMIPYYRLPDVLRRHPELAAVGRLSLWQSLKAVRLVLWDEDGRRLLSFKDARATLAALNCPSGRTAGG
jgi:omega-6 fatty acid desaturase (delta-12 desaturase)